MTSPHTPAGQLAALIAMAVISTPVVAQQMAQKMAPGLWEHSSTVRTQGGEGADAAARMQQQLASLPPEQRKMIEERMAKQGVGMGAKPNSVRVCLSPEQAARGDVPADDARCKREVLSRSGSTLRFKFSCDGPPASSGEGEYTLSSDKAYTMTMKMTSSGGAGKGSDQPRSMEMQGSGRWVAADCGTLKPRP